MLKISIPYSFKTEKLNLYLFFLFIIFKLIPYITSFFVLCVCVFVVGHQTAECVLIMRWWSSKLGQWPLQNLGSVANYYVLFTCPAPPSLPVYWYVSGGVSPLLSIHPLQQRPSCLLTGSSAHLGVTCLRPRIPMHPNNNKLL